MRKDLIENWASNNGISVSPAQMEKLEALQNLVLKINERMNLTAIKTPEDFAVKHIIDSMTLLPYIKKNATVLDIGTGAGFPGIVLRIMRDDIMLDLMDSSIKRMDFIRYAVDELKISGPGRSRVEFIPARASDWAQVGAQYDICTARAVATLDKLVKQAVPLMEPDGLFLAMKGPDVTEELEKAKPALQKIGGFVDRVDIVEIAEGLKHSIVVIRR